MNPRMKLKGIIAFFGIIFTASAVSAQNTSTSPYSYYGIGELLFDSNIEQHGMGGISAVPVNPFYSSANFSNPAANRDLRYTAFDFSVNTDMVQFKDNNATSKRSTTYISNVSLAFPMGAKARGGFGFQPYSSTGYNLYTIKETEEINYGKTFTGKGGLNSIHLMGSYNLTPEFTVGVRANFLFGTADRTQTLTVEDLALQTDYTTKTKANGAQFTLGSMYTKRIGQDKRFDVGATYTLGSKINAEIEDFTITYSEISLTPTNVDTILYQKIDGKIKLPQAVSLAASYRKDLHWMVGAQFDWGDWGGYAFNGVDDANVNTRIRVSAGGFWIPDFNSYKSYFDRVTYRIGGFYESTPLKINGTRIKNYGFTFGFGLPIGKGDPSMLNIAAELGRYGTIEGLTVRENYAKLKIGFTINDSWFKKRVID